MFVFWFTITTNKFLGEERGIEFLANNEWKDNQEEPESNRMFKDKFSSLVSKSGSKLAGLKEALNPAGSSLVEEVPEEDIDIDAHQSS